MDTLKFGNTCSSSGAAFALAVERAGVVGAVQLGAFAQVITLEGCIVLQNGSHLFQIRIGDIAVGIVTCD